MDPHDSHSIDPVQMTHTKGKGKGAAKARRGRRAGRRYERRPLAAAKVNAAGRDFLIRYPMRHGVLRQR